MMLIICFLPSACSQSKTWDLLSLPWQQEPSWTTEDTCFWKCFSAPASAVSVLCLSIYNPTHVRHFWAAVFDSSRCFSSLQLHWWRWWRCTLWIISKVREDRSCSFCHVRSQHTLLLTATHFSPLPLPPGGDLNRSASARAKLQKEATSDAEWVALTLLHPPSLLFRPLNQQLDKHLRNIMTTPTRIIKWNRQMG